MVKDFSHLVRCYAEEFYIKKKLSRKNLNSELNFSEELDNVRKILVIPSNASGGILNSSYVVKMLKERYPSSEIRISIPNNWASVVTKFEGIDATISDWNSEYVWTKRYLSQIDSVSAWGPDLLIRLGTRASLKENFGSVMIRAKLRLCYFPDDLTSEFWNFTLVKDIAGLSDFKCGTALMEVIGLKNDFQSVNRTGAFKYVFGNEIPQNQGISVAVDAENLLISHGKNYFNDLIETLQSKNYKVVMILGLARPSTVSYLIKMFGGTAVIHSATDMLSIGSVLLQCNASICGVGDILHWSNAVGTPTICAASDLSDCEITSFEEEGLLIDSSNKMFKDQLALIMHKLEMLVNSENDLIQG